MALPWLSVSPVLGWSAGMAANGMVGIKSSGIRVTTARMSFERPPNTHATVVFLRHGQSTWNEASLFTGW